MGRVTKVLAVCIVIVLAFIFVPKLLATKQTWTGFEILVEFTDGTTKTYKSEFLGLHIWRPLNVYIEGKQISSITARPFIITEYQGDPPKSYYVTGYIYCSVLDFDDRNLGYIKYEGVNIGYGSDVRSGEQLQAGQLTVPSLLIDDVINTPGYWTLEFLAEFEATMNFADTGTEKKIGQGTATIEIYVDNVTPALHIQDFRVIVPAPSVM